MGNFISFFQEIFMMKDDNSTKVGLSAYRDVSVSVENVQKTKAPAPKELKISELIRKGNY